MSACSNLNIEGLGDIEVEVSSTETSSSGGTTLRATTTYTATWSPYVHDESLQGFHYKEHLLAFKAAIALGVKTFEIRGLKITIK